MKYLVVLEQGPTSWGATVPDLPGCMAVGETRENCESNIQEAIKFHLEGLREDGQEAPSPRSESAYVVIG